MKYLCTLKKRKAVISQRDTAIPQRDTAIPRRNMVIPRRDIVIPRLDRGICARSAGSWIPRSSRGMTILRRGMTVLRREMTISRGGIAVGFILFLSFCCAGCHWSLRSANDVPPQLKVLSLDSDNVDSQFRIQLTHLLESMKIDSVHPAQQAPLTLKAYHYSLKHNNPPTASTNVAIDYTYTLKVTVEIADARGRIVVPPYPISVSRTVSINVNQIFTINSVTLFQQDLQRDAINLIYYWLTSEQTRRLLQADHANSPQATSAAS